MFLVQPSTVTALFDAQRSQDRGKLRLDVSSRVFPSNLKRPFEMEKAREAVAERFLRGVAAFADTLAVNLPADHGEKWVVLLHRRLDGKVEYTAPLGEHLCRVYGLRCEERHDALDQLGGDFIDWLQNGAKPPGVRLYAEWSEAFVECRVVPYDSVEKLLGEADSQPRLVEKFVVNGKWKA